MLALIVLRSPRRTGANSTTSISHPAFRLGSSTDIFIPILAGRGTRYYFAPLFCSSAFAAAARRDPLLTTSTNFVEDIDCTDLLCLLLRAIRAPPSRKLLAYAGGLSVTFTFILLIGDYLTMRSSSSRSGTLSTCTKAPVVMLRTVPSRFSGQNTVCDRFHSFRD